MEWQSFAIVCVSSDFAAEEQILESQLSLVVGMQHKMRTAEEYAVSSI